MQRERQNKQNKADEEKKEGYIIVTNYFLKKWVRVLGVGPVVLYQELLTYCHKGKYIAWPTIDSLCQQMGIAKTTLLRYQDTLIRFGLIKNITRGKSTTGHYRNNIYQITPLEELSKHPDQDNIIDFVGSKMKPDWYQNDTSIGSNMILSLVSKRYPNNTNLKQYQGNNNKERENVAVADFKKLKEKGEERMQAVREQLRDLDIEGKFIEQLLKDYPPKKIEEKIDLLMERKNIQSPAGWLSAALKNDYQDREQERDDEEPEEQVSRQTPLSHLNSPPSMGEKFRETITDSHLSPEDEKIQSRERVLKMIRKTQKMLANLKTKGGTNVRTKISNY